MGLDSLSLIGNLYSDTEFRAFLGLPVKSARTELRVSRSIKVVVSSKDRLATESD
jgi:hypothetical protein